MRDSPVQYKKGTPMVNQLNSVGPGSYLCDIFDAVYLNLFCNIYSKIINCTPPNTHKKKSKYYVHRPK